MTERLLRVKDILERTKISRRQLGLWEKYKIIEIHRETNPTTGNKDRRFDEDDVKQILWLKQKMKEGLSVDAIRLLVEYYTQGQINSVQWFK